MFRGVVHVGEGTWSHVEERLKKYLVLRWENSEHGGGYNQIFAKEEDFCLVVPRNRMKANG